MLQVRWKYIICGIIHRWSHEYVTTEISISGIQIFCLCNTTVIQIRGLHAPVGQVLVVQSHLLYTASTYKDLSINRTWFCSEHNNLLPAESPKQYSLKTWAMYSIPTNDLNHKTWKPITNNLGNTYRDHHMQGLDQIAGFEHIRQIWIGANHNGTG